MDSAMRDLNRIRERDEDAESGGRRVALFGLAGAAVAALVLALCFQVGRGSAEATIPEEDPLARLDRAAGLSPIEPTAEGQATPEVDTVALTFPEALGGEDERPEVAAALAAAAAELEHPDPLPPPPVPAADYAARIPAALPAAVSADTSAPVLARTASRDPLVAEALPEAQLGEEAPAGHDGEYTIQVISYDSPDGAHAFAAGLRARGHRAFVLRAEVEGRGTVYRVRIGPFENMAQAAQYRARFEDTEHMNTIVVRRRSE